MERCIKWDRVFLLGMDVICVGVGWEVGLFVLERSVWNVSMNVIGLFIKMISY